MSLAREPERHSCTAPALSRYRALRDQILSTVDTGHFQQECDRLVFDKAVVSYRLILSISFNASWKSSPFAFSKSPIVKNTS
jgi:hypothetical protein